MAFCGKCGSALQEEAVFCPTCGAAANRTMPELELNGSTNPVSEQTDINQNKGMSVLAYLGLLWLIPFFTRKESKYTQYHCKQGFNLLLLEFTYSVLSIILSSVIKTRQYVYGIYIGTYTPGWLTAILGLLAIPLTVLAIMGIVNAVGGKKKELPIIGKYKILK